MATKKVEFVFNPFRDVKVPSNKRAEASKEIKAFVLEQVLDHAGSGKSPVSGGAWKRSLSKGYKSVKARQSSVGFANLELTGDMLDSLKVTGSGESLKLKVSSSENAKADGNNRGTYGKARANRGKAREFIPQKDKKQTFNRTIWRGINEIAKEFEDGE